MIDKAHAAAAVYGGLCLSTECPTAKSKLTWQCASGHQWITTYDHVVNSSKTWCPECKCNVSVGELTCKAALEHMWPGHKFEKERPHWLTNEDGYRLELDGVNHSLKLAYEYDGEQHYKPSTFGSVCTQEEGEKRLLQIRSNDAVKTLSLPQRGYVLLRVGYKTAMSDIYSTLETLCMQAGRRPPHPSEPFEYTKVVKGKPALHKRWSDYALNMGGHLLTSIYCNPTELMEWSCSSGHLFKMSANFAQSGKWCPDCANARKRTTLEEVQHCAKVNGGELISTLYTGNNNDYLSWKCAEGHTFTARLRTIRSGYWCQSCGNKLKHSKGDQAIQRKLDKEKRIGEMKAYRTDMKNKLMQSHAVLKLSAGGKVSNVSLCDDERPNKRIRV